jgi:catechol 2,3-dioxygenase-like lactoylglutathione lyase family enzyme
MTMRVGRIFAVTFRVANMAESVRFYRNVLGMEVIYGGECECFSSLRAEDAPYPILNLEQGEPVTRWGRLIFYVTDVDAFWAYLRGKGFHPESPRDASWGERVPGDCETKRARLLPRPLTRYFCVLSSL